MLFKFVSALVLSAAAIKYPVHVKGQGESAARPTMENVFLVDLVDKSADCAAYVTSHLTTQGVLAKDIQIRTNYNLGEFGNICSISVANHAGEIFDLPGGELYAVHSVPPIAPLVSSQVSSLNRNATSEKIHQLTGVDKARNLLGLTGKGIKVAVLDTGVFWKHPALGGGFGPGFKVAYGYDLVGDNYGARGNASVIVPDADPLDDCSDSSHGTHVAGIIGADATGAMPDGFAPPIAFTGSAPGASIGAYRIFGCSAAGTATDIITAAILMAAKDGSNIINLSVGGGPAYSEGSDAVAAIRVGKKGHFVVASNGNDGASGAYAAGSPGISHGGLGVGSFDNAEAPKSIMTLQGVVFPVGFGAIAPAFPDSFDISKTVVNDLEADVNNVLVDGLTPTTVNCTGVPLLIRWGTGSSKARCDNACSAGASACILYDNTEAGANINGSPLCPSVFVPRAAGQAIIAAIKAKTPFTGTVTPKLFKAFPLITAGTLSSFSSRGLDLDLFIKPDLSGVGGQVLSTISLHAASVEKPAWGSPYAVLSGTSMSSPNLAGCLALLLESHKSQKFSFDEIRGMLQNTAQPATIFNSTLVESVSAQGAGLVDIYKAITFSTVVLPSRIQLNDTTRMERSYTLKITNKGSTAATYDISSLGAVMIAPFAANDDSIQGQLTTANTADYASVRFNGKTTFKINARDTKEIKLSITPPKTASLFPIYSGYVVITNDRDEETVRVPYAGVIGNWNNAPVWSRNSPSLYKWLTGVTGPLNVTSVSTGLFQPDFAFKPLQKKEVLNATLGSIVLPLASTTTRNATISLSFEGSAYSKTVSDLKKLGLKANKLPLPYFGTIDLAAGTISPAGPFVGAMQRMAPVAGQSIALPKIFSWDGAIGNGTVFLPAGQYKMSFYGQKHFGRTSTNGAPNAGNIGSFDVIHSQVFDLVY